ncbi:MAG: 1-acyl-sn-glycerol-3-phosphate acyltransferase [Burkholderiaceae bacterium]
MTDTVVVPLWLLVLLATLAGWSVLVLLLAPAIRWFLRRRLNRVVERVNTSLATELPSFKLTRRLTLIDRVCNDPKVQAAAAEHAAGSGEALAQVQRRIERYAREIVPSFNAYIYFRIGYSLSRAIARLLYRVRIGFADETLLGGISPKSTLVFVMNHRSNMDYILVSFLAAEKVTLSYAVGEWARIWGLQQLIRAMGAFFVRRNSGDPLYRVVLSRYVQMATEAGVTQAMFPEGGLTVDGKIRAPRFGLLDYMLKGFDEREADGRRDLVFLPVGLNYDRVLEDRTQLLKLHPESPRPGRIKAVRTLLAFWGGQLWRALNGSWHRFGYACVNFGAPLSMRAWCRENGVRFPDLPDAQRKLEVTRVAEHLMQQIGQVIPVLPVSLVAALFVDAPGRRWSELELKAAMHLRMARLQAHGAHQYIPRQDQDYAFGVGLRMLVQRHMVIEDGGLFCVASDAHELVAYYANAIAHLDGAGAALGTPGATAAQVRRAGLGTGSAS